jgi:LPXTG-motif cell wall-anchored protein
MKTLMVLILLAVLGALAGAGVLMLRKRRENDPHGRQMARALALRVGLSVALFLLIMLGWAMGWVRPGGLPVGG